MAAKSTPSATGVAPETETLREAGWSDDRLTDAVNNLIRTYAYPSPPRIADILGFDRKIKIYTYNQVCDMVANGEKFSNFEKYNEHWVLRVNNNHKAFKP